MWFFYVNLQHLSMLFRWKTIDHKPAIEKIDQFTADILYNLKPFTKYALYVETYTIMTAKRGARSVIQYFTTLPDSMLLCDL